MADQQLLHPWPQNVRVPVTRRMVARVLGIWRREMPPELRDLLESPAATEYEEGAVRTGISPAREGAADAIQRLA